MGKARKVVSGSCALIGLALAVGSCGSEPNDVTTLEVGAGAGSGGAQTGQGIMVNLNAAGSFAVETTNTYRYDEAVAASYFGNAWDGVAPPPANCTLTGVTTGSGKPVACTPPTPAVPAAPAPDDAKKGVHPGHNTVVGSSQCTFLDGGVLTAIDSYTQTASASSSCTTSNRIWTLTCISTFTYNIAPLSSDPVAPFTAWPLVDSHGNGAAHVSIGADIAGESVLVKGSTKKYSFSMQEADLTNRVQNLAVTVDGVVSNPGSTLVFPADFTYVTNAGSNGNTQYLTNGDARTILNTDGFAGNDNGGADGSALTKAVMDPVSADLVPGDHSVALTGSVKGNSASADIGFSVQQIIHVITPGCGMGS